MDGAKKLLPLLAAPFLLAFALALALVFLLGSLMNINAEAAACTMSPANGADSASFAWPTDKHEISQDWADPDPDTGNSHSGMDFKVDEGSKVYAVADGTVSSVAKNEIVLKLGEGAEAHYKYLKDVLVSNGKTVKKGDQIATSGSGDEDPPGLTGAHLHLEIWLDKDGEGHLENAHMDTNPFVVQDTGDDSSNACGCPGGDLSGANNQQKAFNYFVSQGYTKEQAAGVVGNMIAESGVEPGRKQGTPPGTVTKPADVVDAPGNVGWGIVQWTPPGKMIKPSRTAGASDDQIASLAFQLDFLHRQLLGQTSSPEKAAGDALKAATTVEDAAHVFADKYERFGGHEDPNAPTYAEREANARHVLSTFGGGATDPKDASAPVDPCGAGSGNIAEVAKNLAWPQGPKAHWSVDPSEAKPEYVAAIEKYDGVTKDNWRSLDDPYSDCGRFVATVVRMSGADPNFPQVYTPTQRQYMLDHPEKYDHWENEPPGGYKPGDILNGPGHTYLYVGPWGDGGGWNSAAGSLGQHVPTADNLYGVGPDGFWVFRVKGGTTPTTTPKN
ncbi:phage tail tip lysozyme [Kribbella jejuensis]|uniref:Peptidase M23-like protein n=1 Tax=Kribbella jejuensis TaxID=236068 RepID=A0A542ETR5_9ACTN|nr:phage tail tip lysozyme [Kribbella jejuensis]TQJ18752.1 peptidase M23-like protein [Kribbella jejuensis]